MYVKEQYNGDLRGEGSNVLYFFYVFHMGEGEMGGICIACIQPGSILVN